MVPRGNLIVVRKVHISRYVRSAGKNIARSFDSGRKLIVFAGNGQARRDRRTRDFLPALRRRILTRRFVGKSRSWLPARGWRRRQQREVCARERGAQGRGIIVASSAVLDGCGFLYSSQTSPSIALASLRGRTCRFRSAKSYPVTASPFSRSVRLAVLSCRRLLRWAFVAFFEN